MKLELADRHLQCGNWDWTTPEAGAEKHIPSVGNWKLESGNCHLGTGIGKLETGIGKAHETPKLELKPENWKTAIWKLEQKNCYLEIGSWNV